jgi:hypothetical protein
LSAETHKQYIALLAVSNILHCQQQGIDEIDCMPTYGRGSTMQGDEGGVSSTVMASEERPVVHTGLCLVLRCGGSVL